MVYDIADLRIEIKNKYEYTDNFCREYLSSDQTSNCDVFVEISEEELKKEKLLSPGYSDAYIENLSIYRKICEKMPEFDRFLLHTAVLEYRGEGYAFLGKSGTGKSTHTGLWLKNLEEAKILNGDKPIVGFDGGKFIVYGTPWMGKERLGYNGKAPLKTLCFIEQAKENSIEKIPVESVAQRLFKQILLNGNPISITKTLELADILVKSVPAYLLKCDISNEAFKTSFDCLTGVRDEF